MTMPNSSAAEPKKLGLVHLYVGNGKGKTTASAGLSLRVLGKGEKVLFTQFLKGRATNEIAPLEKLGAVVRRAKCGTKFVFQMNEEEKAQLVKDHTECLAQTAKDAAEGTYRLIVLDEVVDAVNVGAVALDDLLKLLRERAPHVEVVMTGRNPDPAIVDAADYYTEFVCRKHPYEKGVPSRAGVEF